MIGRLLQGHRERQVLNLGKDKDGGRKILKIFAKLAFRINSFPLLRFSTM